MKHSQDEKMRLAQQDFERNYGVSEEVTTYMSVLGSEKVIVVESFDRRAYYSLDIDLLKIDNFID